ncbi:hypothetical protein GCM10022393_43230 [Aquimarina addita]|uniref:Uncharacterized protein n=2 Tax=Aquimarina addita TaxID=870485 RepID=A0ABP6UZB2_9FLAO
MNVYSSYRETSISRNMNTPDIIIDNSLKYEIVFTHNPRQKVVTATEITTYSNTYKGTPDSFFINKSDKNKIKQTITIKAKTLYELFDLFKKESDTNYENQKVLSTPFEISMELTKGSETIEIKRKEHPTDYINHWSCNGKEIFNPKIDQIIAKILPDPVLGNFKLEKIPSKKAIKYHKEELNKILNRFTYYLQSNDSINLRALAYELYPNIQTIRYLKKNNLYYRGIPEVFQHKSEEEIKIALKQGRERYAASFLKLLNKKGTIKNSTLLTKNDEIEVEYSGFLKDFRGSSKIDFPRGNGAIETTHFYFKVKINDTTYRYSFGEMLRVHDQWLSFTGYVKGT